MVFVLAPWWCKTVVSPLFWGEAKWTYVNLVGVSGVLYKPEISDTFLHFWAKNEGAVTLIFGGEIAVSVISRVWDSYPDFWGKNGVFV